MSKFRISKNLILTLATLFLLFIPVTALAQNEFTFIEPLPGVGQPGEETALDPTKPILEQYLTLAFKVGIGAAAILAVMMIVIGGIRYISASISPSEKEAAKRIIQGAVGGLILILVAWLMLFTINPDFVNVGLQLRPIEGVIDIKFIRSDFDCEFPNGPDADPPTTDVRPDFGNLADDKKMRSMLDSAGANGIDINNKQWCGDVPFDQYRKKCLYEYGSCTSVGDLPDEIVPQLADLEDRCRAWRRSEQGNNASCEIEITGGSELGHRTHGKGKHIVDINKNVFCFLGFLNIERRCLSLVGSDPISEYIINKSKQQCISETKICARIWIYDIDGETEFLDEGDHWHVKFPEI